MKLRDGAIMLLLAAIWGTSFLLIRIAAPVLGPIVLVTARMLIAGSVLLLYAVVMRRPILSRHAPWKAYLVLGTINSLLPLTLEAVAVVHLNASLAAVLATTSPLFTALAAMIWLHERVTWQKGVGLILGLVGVIILVGASPVLVTPAAFLAVGAALLSALLYAIGTIYARGVLRATSALPLVIGQELVAGILLLPISWLTPPIGEVTPLIVWATLSLALIMTAGGNLLYFYLLERVGPTTTQSVSFLVPAFALLAGVLLLGEPFTMSMLLGLAVIVTSIGLITGLDPRISQSVAKRLTWQRSAAEPQMLSFHYSPFRMPTHRSKVAHRTPASFDMRTSTPEVYDRHSRRVGAVSGRPAPC